MFGFEKLYARLENVFVQEVQKFLCNPRQRKEQDFVQKFVNELAFFRCLRLCGILRHFNYNDGSENEITT